MVRSTENTENNQKLIFERDELAREVRNLRLRLTLATSILMDVEERERSKLQGELARLRGENSQLRLSVEALRHEVRILSWPNRH